MLSRLDSSVIVGVVSLVVFCVAVWAGVLCARLRPVDDDERHDLNVVTSGSLTLLALIIGFSFSMAVNRYDLRKNCEMQEASAISTEFIRVDLLPAADAAKAHQLLKQFTSERIQYYEARNQQTSDALNRETEKLNAELWATVVPGVKADPTPPMAAVMTGMNDVLNTQTYTQAAWWNRIPPGAWDLMIAFSVFCCLLLGYGVRRRPPVVLMLFPVVMAVAIFLIAEIDIPGRGLVRVTPQNLVSLSQSLNAQ